MAMQTALMLEINWVELTEMDCLMGMHLAQLTEKGLGCLLDTWMAKQTALMMQTALMLEIRWV